jgi:hypothetical protein
MPDPTLLPSLLSVAIDAHGGAARWRELSAVEAVLSVRGALFAAKHRPALERVRVTACTREPRFAFHDFPHPGETSELLGDDEVRVIAQDGIILARRARPRAAFRHWRRQLYWDHLDLVYFGGYATWNYLATPFLFLRSGFAFEDLPLLQTAEGGWAGVRVTFPADLPTHCRTQDFYFDAQHRLRRLDYTAEVVGRWAHAAHLCEEHRGFDGFLVPTRRTVRPLPFGRRPLPFPTLVAIEVHEFEPVPARRS